MLTVLTIAGLVLLALACIVGIVAVVVQCTWFEYLLWGHGAVESAIKLIGLCIVAILEILTSNNG
jgi:hypothetical protein